MSEAIPHDELQIIQEMENLFQSLMRRAFKGELVL